MKWIFSGGTKVEGRLQGWAMWTQGPPAVGALGLPDACVELETGSGFTVGTSTTGTVGSVTRMVCSNSNPPRCTTQVGNVFLSVTSLYTSYSP